MTMRTNAAYWIAGQAGLFPLAYGLPGFAKTASTAALAAAKNLLFYNILPSTHEPTDFCGVPSVAEYKLNDDGTIRCMEMLSPRWVLEALSKPAILVVDEVTCCTPAMQAAIMGMVLEGRVGDRFLPKETLRYGLCNPADIASNGFPLEAPLANRIMHHQWKFPREDWISGMMSGQEFPNPEPPVVPDDWETNLFETSALIAEFHESVGGYLYPDTDDNGMVVLSSTERSRAWPSPRTWSLAARGLAAAKSVNADEETQNDIVEGLVGIGAAAAFDEWSDNMDIPKAEPVIEAVARGLQSNRTDEEIAVLVPELFRADKVRVFLSSVTGKVVENNTRDRWHAAQEILRQTMKVHKEVALVCAGPLFKHKPKNVKLSPEMVETVWSTVGRTLDEKGGES